MASAQPPAWRRHGLRALALLALATASLQAAFVARIALMGWVDPQSTSFQRSEIWRLALSPGPSAWGQQWVDGERISVYLKRAVIASEDAGFVDHAGIDWAALEEAWSRNQRAEANAERRQARQAQQPPRPGAPPRKTIEPKLIGGSTISQQLAKNLFLSGERSVLRKAQELVLTLALEALLSKDRILEIYLNNVEWGEGLFGAQAAARWYWRVDAARLAPAQAARLAVMLPAPKRFERNPGSAYLTQRSAVILGRMDEVPLP